VQERAAPPTFEVVAEMVDRSHWVIQDVAFAVDTILQGVCVTERRCSQAMTVPGIDNIIPICFVFLGRNG